MHTIHYAMSWLLVFFGYCPKWNKHAKGYFQPSPACTMQAVPIPKKAMPKVGGAHPPPPPSPSAPSPNADGMEAETPPRQPKGAKAWTVGSLVQSIASGTFLEDSQGATQVPTAEEAEELAKKAEQMAEELKARVNAQLAELDTGAGAGGQQQAGAAEEETEGGKGQEALKKAEHEVADLAAAANAGFPTKGAYCT